MKYFELRTSSEPSVIGVKNGIYQIELSEDKYPKEQLNTIMGFFTGNYSEDRDVIPDFDFTYNGKALKGAKITDFMGICPNFLCVPFMISDKVKFIFEAHKMARCKFINAQFEMKGKQQSGFSLLYSPYIGYEKVNFARSIFYTGLLRSPRTYHSIQSSSEFKAFVTTQNAFLKAEKLMFTEDFDKDLDFFQSRIGRFYISDQLKKALIEAKVTGVDIIETKDPVIAF